MSNVIKDGTGNGFLAKVSSHNRLYTRSVAVPLGSHKAQLGRAYVLNTGCLTVTTTKGLMAWIGYTHQTKSVCIERMNIFWNGGNTNHNRCVQVAFNVGDTVPGTNTSAMAIHNANTASANVLSGSALKWDEVGSGMTGHTSGVQFSESCLGQGKSLFELDGNLIAGPGSSMSVYAKGEEAGEFAFSAWFFELDVEEMT